MKNLYFPGDTKKSLSKSPTKRARPSSTVRLNASRSSQGNGSSVNSRGSQSSRARAMKDRECPLAASCNNRGHLSGKSDTHFTMEACPYYHNLTPQDCVLV